MLFIFLSSQCVVSLLSHSLDGNQDRSTRTLSAAVTLQWQTTALHPKYGHYSQHTAHPYQKTRQVLWLLEKVVNITKRIAPWNWMCSVKRKSIDIKGQVLLKKKKKSCPHNVENRSTGHTQQVIYNGFFFFFCFLSESRASSGHCECNRERKKQKCSSSPPCHWENIIRCINKFT